MLEKKLVEEILGVAMSSGADFAELFAERSRPWASEIPSICWDERTIPFLT